jgi:hypothetical protein
MKASSIISTQRSYSDLIKSFHKVLPAFLGFEGLGILFRDIKTDALFAISDQYDESDLKNMKSFDEKIKKGEKLTENEKLLDIERQYKAKTYHMYPNSLGITGQVFLTGKHVLNNNVDDSSNFLPSVDNLSDVLDVHNLLVVPVYGHRDITD